MQRPRQGLARIPVFSYGFRPFFLAAATWAALAMILWLGVLFAGWSFADDYGAIAWHAHELVIGYTSAVVTGFLLTAIPNWTGRLPVRGGPLLSLFLLWLIGRVAMLSMGHIGPIAAMAIDSLFLVALVFVILREIVSGRNWRNLKTVVLVLVLAAANIGFHLETYAQGFPDYSLRAAIAAIVALIMLVGGRIVPSFTRNWLARHGAAVLPVPFNRFDIAAIVLSGLALTLWVFLPLSETTAIALVIGGALQVVRMVRWAGFATWREPLVFILHVGYFFVPLGFVFVGAAILWPGVVFPSAALHAWTTGAIGVMTLAVMTRATLGHTGNPLTAGPATSVIYLAIVLAVLARISASLAPELMTALLSLAALAWIVAFAGFAFVFGPKLLSAGN